MPCGGRILPSTSRSTARTGSIPGETNMPATRPVLDRGLQRKASAVLRAWRKNGRHLPVLILTARDGWTDKVEGFKAGADDYVHQAVRRRRA